MDGSITSGTLIALAVAAVALAAVVVLGVLLVRERRRTDAALAAVFAGQADLRRLLEATAVAADGSVGRTKVAEFVITDAGQPEPPVEQVPDRVVLSATLGEPLVKAAAFTFGVRRALSAESRNRIRFAMRSEVRRSRKQRKKEMREAWRRMRAEDAGSAA